jgi:hypothetical protein
MEEWWWVQTSLVRRTLNARIGSTELPATFVMKLWASALTGAAVAWAMLILCPYCAVYFGARSFLQVPEGMKVARRIPEIRSRNF